MTAGYLLALTTGFLGGFGHCIGMCGPLVASFTLASSSDMPQPLSRSIAPHLLYNMGRITTYGMVGALMGLSGSFVNIAGGMTGIQNAVAIITGIIMIALGFTIVTRSAAPSWIEKHNLPVLRAAKRSLDSASLFRYYPFGLLMGLLPCGLSYTIFIAAAGSGGAAVGMTTALLFGLGTLPALFFFGALVTVLSSSLRGMIYRASGAVVVLMGFYFLIKGFRLYADL